MVKLISYLILRKTQLMLDKITELRRGETLSIYTVKLLVGSQIVAQTQVEKGNGLNKPNTINL